MSIFFRRQPDGSYKRSGELPSGTRYTCIVMDGVQLSAVLKTQVWLDVLEKGPLRAQVYELAPASAPVLMTEDAKEKLKKVSSDKKAAKKLEEESLEKEEKSMKVEARKRRKK